MEIKTKFDIGESVFLFEGVIYEARIEEIYAEVSENFLFNLVTRVSYKVSCGCADGTYNTWYNANHLFKTMDELCEDLKDKARLL